MVFTARGSRSREGVESSVLLVEADALDLAEGGVDGAFFFELEATAAGAGDLAGPGDFAFGVRPPPPPAFPAFPAFPAPGRRCLSPSSASKLGGK